MKLSSKTLFFIWAMILLMALVATSLATKVEKESRVDDDEVLVKEEKTLISLRGISRFLSQKDWRPPMTCNKYPRVCRTKGSPGPDCCKKKCVNVKIDKVNCGKCGKKCKYMEVCCKGKCIQPLKDKNNCGKCGNKCKKGTKCAYGMCHYGH
ncbi:stigma-specific STIG1-like protein 3 [Impatiens glandulifera]|uniref:stigma-specific STIG1-like protein 3 n=1 Tax=Impatiens glandulifera TaxID=253017 RepID=UPI001FB08081|nr:stigma-specific STIG1-like protein 3 [Impatiens glandulifera]